MNTGAVVNAQVEVCISASSRTILLYNSDEYSCDKFVIFKQIFNWILDLFDFDATRIKEVKSVWSDVVTEGSSCECWVSRHKVTRN